MRAGFSYRLSLRILPVAPRPEWFVINLTANDPAYPFGKRPLDGAPKTLTPFPELHLGRDKATAANESLLNTPEWQYVATLDAELARRAAQRNGSIIVKVIQDAKITID